MTVRIHTGAPEQRGQHVGRGHAAIAPTAGTFTGVMKARRSGRRAYLAEQLRALLTENGYVTHQCAALTPHEMAEELIRRVVSHGFGRG